MKNQCPIGYFVSDAKQKWQSEQDKNLGWLGAVASSERSSRLTLRGRADDIADDDGPPETAAQTQCRTTDRRRDEAAPARPRSAYH